MQKKKIETPPPELCGGDCSPSCSFGRASRGFFPLRLEALLGGSWVVISGVVSPPIWVTTIVTLLITPLITTHEPPSGA